MLDVNTAMSEAPGFEACVLDRLSRARRELVRHR
jgi:hypothetical protein